MKRFLALSLVALTALGCSGGGASSSDQYGDASVVLTDAASDELAQFEVDVGNIVFTRRNGDTVAVMPRSTRVDFAQLDSLGELVSGLSLPAGVYTRATLDLDFTDAQVVIDGQTTPASVRDASGAPITGIVPVTIDFPSGSRPLVGAARNNLFVFDLDLDQSIAVDATGNSVTFTPVFSVELDPTNPHPIATTGVLHSVDANAGTFVVERRTPDDLVVREITVLTANDTAFQIDGGVQLGAPGLGNLIGHIGERVFVQGTIAGGTFALAAAAVEIGAGVPGNGQDWLLGHVVARSGGPGLDATLTVLGRSRDVGTGTRTYNTQHTVTVSFADTKVLRRGAGNGLDSDAIGIGQRVWVFGDLTGTALDATATTGVVRLLPTSVFGIANSAPANDTLTLDVTRFDLRAAALFDFTVDTVVQADPHAFAIDVTGLSSTGITTGSKVRAIGWLAGVGSSGADATATTLVDRTSTASLLVCTWTPAANGVVVASGANALGVDVAGAALHTVVDGFGSTTLTAAPQPTLTALGLRGFYRIVQNGGLTVDRDFATFRADVLARGATAPVRWVSAFGAFDAGSQAFAAGSVTVVFD